MRSGSKLYKIGLIAAAVALLLLANLSQSRLNRDRDQLGLTRTAPLENAPPILAFTTVALGGFRGLIANILWIRANDLQEDGKYFEMVQLADWITKLQPYFTTVWIHQAWNMAYNISIKFSDPHDRWLWVLRGIELLRDDGLRYNPHEPLIYRELAWFFQHKIGHYLDDAHNQYKEFWADQFSEVLGPGPSRPNFEALIHPKTEDEKKKAALLHDKFKMDPAVMKEVDDHYGPLEWRLAETHGIYWAVQGLHMTQKEEKFKREDFITLRRVVFQSMQLAFHRGRLIFPRKGQKGYFTGPNLEIVRQTSEAYEEMMNLEPDKRDNIQTGHRNFLKTAVYFLYTHNRNTEATQWFNYLKKTYPKALPAEMTVDQYAFSRVAEDVGETDPNRIKGLLEGMLESSMFSYATGQDEQALGFELFARKVWTRYTTEVKGSATRVALPPIEAIKKEVQTRVLSPDSGLDPILANQLRTRLGLPPEEPSTNNPAPPPSQEPKSPPTTNNASGPAR